MEIKSIYVGVTIDESHLQKLEEGADGCGAVLYKEENTEAERKSIIETNHSNLLDNDSKVGGYKFLLVLDYAERTLDTCLRHDQVCDSVEHHVSHFPFCELITRMFWYTFEFVYFENYMKCVF